MRGPATIGMERFQGTNTALQLLVHPCLGLDQCTHLSYHTPDSLLDHGLCRQLPEVHRGLKSSGSEDVICDEDRGLGSLPSEDLRRPLTDEAIKLGSGHSEFRCRFCQTADAHGSTTPCLERSVRGSSRGTRGNAPLKRKMPAERP